MKGDPIQAAAEDVVRAWVMKGSSPQHHQRMQEQLRKEWPVLAKAVERLVVVHRQEGAK